jgi:hypothetical protein
MLPGNQSDSAAEAKSRASPNDDSRLKLPAVIA